MRRRSAVRWYMSPMHSVTLSRFVLRSSAVLAELNSHFSRPFALMPVLQHETTIRAGKGSSTLKLGVTHSLHFGVDCKLEADANTVIRTPLPYFVDVHSCSDLAITLRVVLDGQLLDKDNTFKKAIDQHFISTLRQVR